jgi:MscS family membrane protein
MFKDIPPSLIRLVKILLVLFIILFALEQFAGINIRMIIGSLGILSLGIALAAGDIFKNLLGGIFVMVDRPFTIDDEIIVYNGTTSFQGVVKIMRLRSTVLWSDKGTITIPNKFMSDNAIIRYKK